MYNKSLIGSVLSMVVCFSMLSVHARAEQSTELSETMNIESPAAVMEAPAKAEPIYTETARDGDLGMSIAQMTPGLTQKAAESVDWAADVASRIQLHGYAQGWYDYHHAGGKNTNTFLCKRVLFWANAQITPRWSFLFMHDFSSVVQEYYTDYRITNNKALTVRFGQYKTALTYENPLSPTAMETIDVYSDGVAYLTNCGMDPATGVQYGRDQGIAVFGETNNKSFRYEVQVLNGSGINRKDDNNQKDVIARLEVRPAKGLNICATGMIGKGHALADSRYTGIKAGTDYDKLRYTFGADYKSKAFNVHGEYLWGKDDNVHSRGAYVTGSVAIVPSKFDFVASYDYFNYNTTKNMERHKVVAGLQYWFFKKCRFQAQYVYRKANAAMGNTHADNQFICQMQVRFN